MEETLEIEKLLRQLDSKNEEMKLRGIKYAEAERDYKVAVAKESLRMKVELEYPVTFINTIIHGCDAVADLRFKRDVQRTNYESVIEEINSLKTKLRIKEAQVKQDYAMARYQ